MKALCCVWVLLGSTLACVAAESQAPAKPLFERDVRPILKAHCFHCHGEGEKAKAGLDVRLVRSMRAFKSEDGAALVPGKPLQSLIYKLSREGEMPKGEKKLTAQQLTILERWIATGAKTARDEPKELPPGPFFSEEDRSHWSFQPIKNPAPPKVKEKARAASPIDQFVLEKLEEKKLSLAPEAERRTLVRRAYLDLLGLPPTPEEADAFVADAAPDAWEKLLDKLLASPQYGERWGRHWLDAAGYADSNGFAPADSERPQAWKYRDYVIRSFNADKPFDRFITEQLAGDELLKPPYDELKPEQLEPLIATGYLRNAPDGTADEIPDQNLARNEVMADTLKIVTTSLLGLTVGCAQCHDHRYDPIPQTDYYRMRAVFEPAYDWKKWRHPAARLVSIQSKADREKAAAIEAEAVKLDAEKEKHYREALDKVFEKQIVLVPEAVREAVRKARNTPVKDLNAEQKALLLEYPRANVRHSLDLYDPEANKKINEEGAKIATLRGTKPVPEQIAALTELPGQIPQTFLFHRGDHDQPKQEIKPGGLAILDALVPQNIPEKDAALPTSGRRLAFAKLITDPRNPLTARVLVNRVWMQHFGFGLVRTPGDFGMLGERPTHPELLDWLASQFVAGGWKLKALHKTIMRSSVYRQSALNPKARAADPDNRLLGRANIRRLDAEAIRDAMLACSGKLNLKQFGPSVPTATTKEGKVIVGQPKLDANGDLISIEPVGDQEFRRSVYVKVRRSAPVTALESFDAPNLTPNCDARACSTAPTQSLMLMNDSTILGYAERMAERLRSEAPGKLRKQITRAWQLAWLRTPSGAELDEALMYVAEQAERIRLHAPPPPKDKAQPEPKFDPQLLALASYCQVLMGANRFLYID